jgi:hypothetical protein
MRAKGRGRGRGEARLGICGEDVGGTEVSQRLYEGTVLFRRIQVRLRGPKAERGLPFQGAPREPWQE